MTSSLIGQGGMISVAIGGLDKPGEVMLTVRGAAQPYIAWSDAAIARGASVGVVEEQGARSVRVTEVSFN